MITTIWRQLERRTQDVVRNPVVVRSVTTDSQSVRRT